MTQRQRIVRLASVVGSLLCIASVVLAAADFEDGLICYLPFEGAGDDLQDQSGNGNDGTLAGAYTGAVRTKDGKFGKAIEFPTFLDGAEVLKTENMLATQDHEGFTVSFWTFATEWNFGGNKENRAVYKHQQYNIDLLAGGGRMEVRIDGGWKGVGTAPEMSVEEWHLTTAVWSAEDGSKYYRDGIVAQENVGTAGDIEENVEWMALGSFGLEAFAGRMDELRIYNRPLDEDEVFELFDSFDPGAQAVSAQGKLTTMWGTVKYYR